MVGATAIMKLVTVLLAAAVLSSPASGLDYITGVLPVEGRVTCCYFSYASSKNMSLTERSSSMHTRCEGYIGTSGTK